MKSRGIEVLKLIVEHQTAKQINFGCSRMEKNSASTEIDQQFKKKV